MSDEQYSEDEMLRFYAEYQSEQYAEEQAALPPHKREGYAERMHELADMRRKAEREENLIRSSVSLTQKGATNA